MALTWAEKLILSISHFFHSFSLCRLWTLYFINYGGTDKDVQWPYQKFLIVLHKYSFSYKHIQLMLKRIPLRASGFNPYKNHVRVNKRRRKTWTPSPINCTEAYSPHICLANIQTPQSNYLIINYKVITQHHRSVINMHGGPFR